MNWIDGGEFSSETYEDKHIYYYDVRRSNCRNCKLGLIKKENIISSCLLAIIYSERTQIQQNYFGKWGISDGGPLEIHFYKQSFLNSFNQLIPQAVLYSKDSAKKVLQELPHIY